VLPPASPLTKEESCIERLVAATQNPLRANEESCIDRLVAVTQNPLRAGGGLSGISRPASGGGGAAAAVAAVVAVEMLGGNASSGKRTRELGGVDAHQGQHHDASRKHAKRPGGTRHTF